MQKKLTTILLLTACLLLAGGCATPRGVWAEVDDVYVNASDRAEDASRRESPAPASTPPPTASGSNPDDATVAQPADPRPTRRSTRPQANRNSPGGRAGNFFLSTILQLLVSLALLLLLYL
jgi:predicted small secreted protein